ncbi:MAG: extracellular solute-binding protein [Lachnospiraceae bacterium]|nr:extracellular solute-binding protein [Lachnospiraceae bacterium]
MKNETEEEAISKGKTILTLADAVGDYGAIAYIVRAFNKDNDFYHVELKTMQPISRQEEQTRLMMDLANGKGPDLMTASAVPDAFSMIPSGCFEDLSPLLSEVGVTDDTFFPSVKALVLENSVYAICPSVNCSGFLINEKALIDKHIPCFEEFIDILFNYPENAMLTYNYSSSEILVWLLVHSESLRGTVNWESRKCDFSGELFSKILDTSKRYGEASGRGYSPIMQNYYTGLGSFQGKSSLEEHGWIKVDAWFDDGNFPVYAEGTNLMINASSEQKEGAKIFLSYVLSNYGQKYFSEPASKSVYRAVMEKELKLLEAGKSHMEVPLTEELIVEMTEICERGRYTPRGTWDILEIIREESEAFFTGEKSKLDVIKIIQSRVQLLLDE